MPCGLGFSVGPLAIESHNAILVDMLFAARFEVISHFGLPLRAIRVRRFTMWSFQLPDQICRACCRHGYLVILQPTCVRRLLAIVTLIPRRSGETPRCPYLKASPEPGTKACASKAYPFALALAIERWSRVERLAYSRPGCVMASFSEVMLQRRGVMAGVVCLPFGSSHFL